MAVALPIKLLEQTNLFELHFTKEDFEVIQILYFPATEFLDGAQNLTSKDIRHFAEKHGHRRLEKYAKRYDVDYVLDDQNPL